MSQGQISVYYGSGKGKTSLTLGVGMRALAMQKKAVMIRFVANHASTEEVELFQRFEPDFRIFQFIKTIVEEGEVLPKEAETEFQTAFQFTKKIIDTGECEVLLLDGILSCIEQGYLKEAELVELLSKKPSYMDVVLTGTVVPTSTLCKEVDAVYEIKECHISK